MSRRSRLPLLAAALILGVFGPSACNEEPPPLTVEMVGCVTELEPWTTCTEFCEWDLGVCLAGGCDGLTAMTLKSTSYCAYEGNREPLEGFGCEDEFIYDETIRAYDCCCDYR